MSASSWLNANGYPGYSESFAQKVVRIVKDGYSIAMAIDLAYGEN